MVKEVNKVHYTPDNRLPDQLALHTCSLCKEETRLENAVDYCQECGDYVCSKCKEAHSRMRIT